MPGWSTCVWLLSTIRVLEMVLRPLTLSSVCSGSWIGDAPVFGVGVIVSTPRLYPPTMFRDLPEAIVTVAEPPFAASAPPLAAVHAESMMTEPSNCIVGPPEIRNAGQPRRPFGHDGFEGS